MSSNKARSPLVKQIISDKAVIAENIGTLNMGDAMLLPPPYQLPPDIQFFSGRVSEVVELKQILSKEKSLVAICSLWGMGGIGKSALAIHVVSELHREGHFQDGILFANLGETKVDDALEDFIRAFNYSESQIPESLQGKLNIYRTILRDKQVLVFLDNVGSAEQVSPFLLNEPGISVIATSRKNLLALTEYAAFIKDLDLFSVEEGAELLKKRIGARYDAEPTIAKKICELAGYLPLAISLAASSLADQNKWPFLEGFFERLEDVDRRLDALSGPDTKDRGLRRVFQVSYDALSEGQKKTIALLTLFENNNFGSSGLVAITGAKKDDAIDQLDEFVNLSLILRSDVGGYRFHDLLFLFAKEKIKDLPESTVSLAKSRLENYLLLVAKARELIIRADLARKKDLNLAIKLHIETLEIYEQLQNRSGQANTLVSLSSIYTQQGQFDDAVVNYQRSLKLFKEIGNFIGQAHCLRSLASLYLGKNELDKAIEYFRLTVFISRELGDIEGQANALSRLAFALIQRGDPNLALEYYLQELNIFEKTNNLNGQASIYGGLAIFYSTQMMWHKAIDYCQKEIDMYKKIGNRPSQAKSLGRMAAIFAQKGDLEQSLEYYQSEFKIYRELGNSAGQAVNLSIQASIFSQKGDLDKAIEYHSSALVMDMDSHNLWGEAGALGGLASAFAKKGDFDQAIKYYQQAQLINNNIGNIKGQAKALGGLAAVYSQQKNWEKVIQYQEQAAKISEILRDIKGQEIALGGIAYAYSKSGNLDKSIEFQLKALELNKTINNPLGEAKAYGALAVVYQNKGDEEKALYYYLEAQKINEKLNNTRGSSRVLGGIAAIYYRKKDWEKAIIYLEKALLLNRKSRDRFLSKTLYQLAVSCKLVGDLEKSKLYIEEAYQLTKGQVDGIVRLYTEFFGGG